MEMNLSYHNKPPLYVNFTVTEAPNYIEGPKRKAYRPLLNHFQDKQKPSI